MYCRKMGGAEPLAGIGTGEARQDPKSHFARHAKPSFALFTEVTDEGWLSGVC